MLSKIDENEFTFDVNGELELALTPNAIVTVQLIDRIKDPLSTPYSSTWTTNLLLTLDDNFKLILEFDQDIHFGSFANSSGVFVAASPCCSRKIQPVKRNSVNKSYCPGCRNIFAMDFMSLYMASIKDFDFSEPDVVSDLLVLEKWLLLHMDPLSAVLQRDETYVNIQAIAAQDVLLLAAAEKITPILP